MFIALLPQTMAWMWLVKFGTDSGLSHLIVGWLVEKLTKMSFTPWNMHQILAIKTISHNPIKFYSSSKNGNNELPCVISQNTFATYYCSCTWAFIRIERTKWNIAEWSRTKKNRAKPLAGMQNACILFAGDTSRTCITHRFSHRIAFWWCVSVPNIFLWRKLNFKCPTTLYRTSAIDEFGKLSSSRI